MSSAFTDFIDESVPLNSSKASVITRSCLSVLAETPRDQNLLLAVEGAISSEATARRDVLRRVEAKIPDMNGEFRDGMELDYWHFLALASALEVADNPEAARSCLAETVAYVAELHYPNQDLLDSSQILPEDIRKIIELQNG